MSEQFVKCKEFYEVSDLGRIVAVQRVVNCIISGVQIVRIKRRKVLLPRKDKDGYVIIGLYENGIQKNFRVHRLVAEAFHPNPEGKQFVNHKNGIKDDNRAINVEWATQSENELHAIKYLGKKQPKGAQSRLSTPMQVVHPDGSTETVVGQNEAARRFGINQGSIWNVLSGKTKAAKGYGFSKLT